LRAVRARGGRACGWAHVAARTGSGHAIGLPPSDCVQQHASDGIRADNGQTDDERAAKSISPGRCQPGGGGSRSRPSRVLRTEQGRCRRGSCIQARGCSRAPARPFKQGRSRVRRTFRGACVCKDRQLPHAAPAPPSQRRAPGFSSSRISSAGADGVWPRPPAWTLLLAPWR